MAVNDAAGLEFHLVLLILLAWWQEGQVKCQSSPEFLSLKEVEEENQEGKWLLKGVLKTAAGYYVLLSTCETNRAMVSTNLIKQISQRFPDVSRRHFNKTLTPEITLIPFTRCTLPNFCWRLFGSDADPRNQWVWLPHKCNHHKKYT